MVESYDDTDGGYGEAPREVVYQSVEVIVGKIVTN